MGMMTEGAILTQVKKAQGETNQRLETLITAQNRTNELLARLVGELTGTVLESSTPAQSTVAVLEESGEKHYYRPFGGGKRNK